MNILTIKQRKVKNHTFSIEIRTHIYLYQSCNLNKNHKDRKLLSIFLEKIRYNIIQACGKLFTKILVHCTYSLFHVYMLLLPQAVYCLVIAASLLLGLEKPENKTWSYHLKYYCQTP